MKQILLILFFFFSFLNAKYLVYEDKDSTLTLDYIKQHQKKLFQKSSQTGLGATQSVIWLSIPLTNKTDSDIFQYIRFREVFLYKIELYDEKKVLSGGSIVPLEERQLPYISDTFEILIPQNSKKQIFVKIIPKYNATYAYDIFTSKDKLKTYQNFFDSIFQSYISIMILILIGAIILYIIFREKLFIIYSYFIFSTIIFQIFQTGRILSFLHFPEIVKYDEIAALCGVFSMILFLVILFKEYRDTSPIFNVLFKIVFIMLFVGVVSLSINFNFYIDLMVEQLILNFALITIFSFVLSLVIKRVRYSIFALLGIFVFIITALLCAMYYIGLIDNPYSLVLMQIGSIIESLAFFSLILYRIYNQVIYEKEKSLIYSSKLNDMQILAKMGTWSENVLDNYITIDKSAQKILEVNDDKFNFENLHNLVHPDDINIVLDKRQRVLSNQGVNMYSYRIITSTGQIKHLSVHCQSHYNEKGILTHLDGYFIDITEKILVEEELDNKQALLTHQQRLAQQGEMLSMIAHQWRQPLTAITATINNLLLKNMIGQRIDSKELSAELKLVNDYSLHLSSTINDFKNFFKSDKKKEPTTLEELIERSLNIIKTSIEFNDISLIKNYSCNKVITSFSNEIQQVILNLIKNAEDVLTERHIKHRKIFLETKCDIDYGILTISDNAGGIDPEIINKIFDPYFSTKKNKEGTGLGLYMSKTIIQEHCSGSLCVENNENGAIFTIKLKFDKKL